MLWVPMASGGLANAVTSINSQTGPAITLQTGSSGTDFTISAPTNTITFNIPSASSSARGLVTTGSQTFAGTKTFSSTISGNLSGTATTSQNVNTIAADSNTEHYLVFSPSNGGSGVALSSDTNLKFTPFTNVLVTDVFSGNLSATGATISTILNAQGNVRLGDAASDTVTFFARVGSDINPSADSSYDLGFTGQVWRNGYIKYLTGTATTFATATFNDTTEATNQTTGSVTFAGGIAVNKKVFSQAIETNGNAIINGNFQVYGGIIQLGNSAAGDTVGFISKIQSAFLPQANNTFDIGYNDTVNAWRNAAFAGHGTFANLYGTSSANLTGVEFSGGDVLIKSGKSIKIYEATNVYNVSFKSNSSLAENSIYTLPVAEPGSGTSILQSDSSGNLSWVKAASNKATYVLSFGAGFTPTTGLDSVSIAIPYANDGSTQLTYTIKRVEVRTETEPGASTLAFYFERHTTGNVTWTASPITIKGAASANFSIAQNNYSAAFTTITSSSGNNGEVQSGNYLRVNFASVGTAANVSISIMIQEN